VARFAISGGSTPKRLFQLLADGSKPFRAQIDWGRLHLYWVDERCVGPEDAESNYRMTKEALLDHVPIPAENVHRMQGELPPEEAAQHYDELLRRSMNLESDEAPAPQWPAFDMLLLGMGDDGHTASIFPHTKAIYAFTYLVAANEVPQKNTWRITLTWPVINAAKDVVFLIEGAGKAERLAEVLLGKYDPETLPSQLIRPLNGKLTFLLDAAAAKLLPATRERQGDQNNAKVGQLELS
jgi:6-phosphogluconolactonase